VEAEERPLVVEEEELWERAFGFHQLVHLLPDVEGTQFLVLASCFLDCYCSGFGQTQRDHRNRSRVPSPCGSSLARLQPTPQTFVRFPKVELSEKVAGWQQSLHPFLLWQVQLKIGRPSEPVESLLVGQRQELDRRLHPLDWE